MATDLAPFITVLRSFYNESAHTDYQRFLTMIDKFPLSVEDISDLKNRFPPPGCTPPAPLPQQETSEELTEGYATDPRDPGPLSTFQDHGWVDGFGPDELRENTFYKQIQSRSPISDREVLKDIQENTLHILGRCNNPSDWGDNKQGLVYGMVQSGKTASMINLLSMGIISGYKLFIILAGDKDSLREQTQKRVNKAFKLTNGINTDTNIQSPTYKEDFGKTNLDYRGTFKTQTMASRTEQYTTIIVMKKLPSHIRALIQQIKDLSKFCDRSNGKFDLSKSFPTMILDDEADYGSQNTSAGPESTPTHAELTKLRKVIPRNCFVAYTATPQACLSADPKDLIGYPKDFFWLLEPFTEEINGQPVTRSYLGAWDAFWQYDDYLLRKIGRNEWPHYEKDDSGGVAQIWIPDKNSKESGFFAEEGQKLAEEQKLFLEEVSQGKRPLPPSLVDSLVDFVISAGVRWWAHWKKNDTSGEPPGDFEVRKSYPHHAIMIHLSMRNDHQMLARKIVEKAWSELENLWGTFKINKSAKNHPFAERWAEQKFRTSRLKPNRPQMELKEIKHFIDLAINIAKTPIKQDIPPYRNYPGNPFTYLVNSSENGMRLDYDDDAPSGVTNRAAIIIGGQILSRGLTIEGLTVSFFGRTAKMPMGDTVLQMGRWFGHKKSYIDLISIYMQDRLRLLFRDIAEADSYLRRQIKDAIFRGLRPDEILLEMRNSPHFRATSPAKSRFVQAGNSAGFSGRRALLREPTFTKVAIKNNNQRLKQFELQYRSRKEIVHEFREKGKLYRDIPVHVVINLLNELTCKNTATQDTYSDYARYLKDWMESDNLPPMPKINIAVMSKLGKRRRELSISKPETAEQAKSTITGRIDWAESLVEGYGKYCGDRFIDKDKKWHVKNHSTRNSYIRKYGTDDILILFYGFKPNYVRNMLFDHKGTGKWFPEIVKLEPGDTGYIDIPDGKEEDYSVLVFAAYTPRGGPQYALGVNTLLDPAKIKQKGLENYQEKILEEQGERL
jgi:hypothetical protein